MKPKSTLIIALLCLATALNIKANPITREQARQKASTFLKTIPGSRTVTPVVSSRRLAPSATVQEDLQSVGGDLQSPPYYVFDRGQDEGYVIVSGDDATAVDVLGYTDHGSFDYSTLPPNMKEWLDGYAAQIKAIQSLERHVGASAGMASPTKRRVAIKTHPKVDQLMTCTWSQGYPYNLTCPEYFTLGRSVTGCVATAMAQILYYNREKSVTETQAAMPAYDTWTSHPTYGQLHVEGIPEGSPIDWDNMKDSYGSATDLQRLAVADLMHYCGVAVKMDYTNASSGAQVWDAYLAFINYFGYGSSTRYVSDAADDAAWDEMVYAELAAGRPVYLSGSNSESGHAFVTDGYDGNLRYHINWGWGGQSDGYYYLTNLTPGQGQGIGGSSDGYNAYRQIIIGLEPENYGTRAMTFADSNVRKICLESFDADGDGKVTYDEAAAVTSLGSAFQGKTAIKSFKELYYFTSLTSLPDDAFSGCTQLTTLRLPKKLRTIGARAFKDCTRLAQLALPTTVRRIGEEAFSGCKTLGSLSLPDEMEAIEARTFQGCAALTAMTLPIGITRIGDEAFAGCTKLSDVTVMTYQPAAIGMGSGVFSDIGLSQATLTVAQGTRSYFSTTAQWQDFGTIRELRELSGGRFAELEKGKKYYIYNIGTGRYLTKGEAWGTQAVVGTDPMRFVINRTTSMPEGCYYLTSEDSGKQGHYLFRTTTDSNVGTGVVAAFVDGTSLTASAYWAITPVATEGSAAPVYTLQIPSNATGYQEGLCWGVQTDHQSGAAQPTYGIYGDVSYEEHPCNCQWSLVLYDEEAATRYATAQTLAALIATATARHLKVDDEQAVYDNLESTTEELRQAQRTLRRKLNFIDFADDQVAAACIASYDIDTDGEIGFSEARQIADFSISFQSEAIASFDELQYFTGIPSIYANTFDGCTKLTSVVLPASVTNIYYYAFRNCRQLKSVNIPELVTQIGNGAFQNCTALESVTVCTPDPSMIALGTNVFSGVTLARCTLYVPFGSKEAFAAADVWKNFGNIVEVRARTQPVCSAIEADKPGYLMNVATRKYLGKGEAWGMQAVVAGSGMLYQFKRTAAMPDGTYYLYSDQTGQDGKVLFRTDSDTKVGEGVKACFVDGTLSAKAYWTVTPVASETSSATVYTLQVPATDDTYTEDQYLGTNPSHKSDYASPTYGAYWDVAGTGRQSQWVFIAQDDMKAAQEADQLADQLSDLLVKARAKDIDITDEQAVYDSPQSTADDFSRAISSLRQKLHIITFADSKTQALCILNWDTDGDEELSWEEAAAVTDLGETFRGATAMKSFEELRYFTSLTSIAANAFYGCSNLMSIYIPEQVDTIRALAFSGCTALKYMAVLNATTVVCSVSTLPPGITFFLPESIMDQYRANGPWKSRPMEVYTGTPVVTATATRRYGQTSATMQYTVSGAPVNGVPEMACEQLTEPTMPVGTYPIVVTPGTITSEGLQCQEGVFTIAPYTLRITAKSYTREKGQQNPEFQLTYSGFRNRETYEVLDKQPVITCQATPASPVGEYEISVAGAEAHNYTITYVAGKLTVTESTRGDVNGDGRKDIADVLCIINAMATGSQDKAADTNGDGRVDQNDIATLINIIVN